MRGRGKRSEPFKWTGKVCRLKCVTEANPGRLSMTAVPSLGNQAEVIGLYAAKKSL